MGGFKKFKLGAQLSHINQLKQFDEILSEPKPQFPVVDKEQILAWVADQEQKGRIARAKANRNVLPLV